MKQKLKLSKILLIAFTIYTLFLCGCNQGKPDSKNEAQQMKADKESDKIPEDLKNIESSIEKIIKALEGPAVSIKDEKENDQQTQDKSSQSEEQESGKENEEGKEENKDDQNSNEQKNSQDSSNQKSASEPKDPWKEISSIINKLHYQWNSYIPSASKKNASRNLIDNFDNSLNNLTSTIVTKDKNKTLLSANSLYLFIPDFYMLYKTPTSPEIKRIRYYIRNTVLNASISNWQQAGKDVGSLKSTWAIYKNTIDAKNQDLASKLDYSIYELEKVVNENNMHLTDIKGRIAMSNTESVEKAAQKNE